MDDIRNSTLDAQGSVSDKTETASQPYIGRWNRLVSTTNWEKGRIVCDWRESLEKKKASPREYSDEAWGRLVGCVTAQHVGRLRRVYVRFGKDYQTYEGLYWSHFQAAIDWDDAEMYLEGAVREGWSVSQMRRTRWEAMGAVESQKPRDEDVVTAELDEDFEPGENSPPESDTLSTSYGEVTDPRSSDSKSSSGEAGATASGRVDEVAAHVDEAPAAEVEPVRPFEQIGELPEDVADAFEQMKLAILRHKADDWREIARDEMLAVLDSLKELALAPSVAGTPF
jgi:hypothetical protein